MLRKALFIIALAGLACGSQEASQSTPAIDAAGGAGDVAIETPPVSAVQPTAAATAAPSTETVTCLELVSVGKYVEAVEVCQIAIGQDPSNTDVAAALQKAGAAKAAADSTSAASAAAGSAIDAAAESAKSAAGASAPTATE